MHVYVERAFACVCACIYYCMSVHVCAGVVRLTQTVCWGGGYGPTFQCL